MRKMYKTQKGITLVALVITIIVLIILAAVSINAVMNDGLIKNAKDAAGKYENAQKEEMTELGKLMQELENVKGSWRYVDNTKAQVTNGETTLNVGTTTNYAISADITDFAISGNKSGTGTEQTITADTLKNLTWNVAGVNENGRLKLVANDVVQISLYGKTGYDNGPEIFSNLETHLGNVSGSSLFSTNCSLEEIGFSLINTERTIDDTYYIFDSFSPSGATNLASPHFPAWGLYYYSLDGVKDIEATNMYLACECPNGDAYCSITGTTGESMHQIRANMDVLLIVTLDSATTVE